MGVDFLTATFICWPHLGTWRNGAEHAEQGRGARNANGEPHASWKLLE
jgi:hypothetical protein